MTQEKVKYLFINFSVGSRLLHTRCWAHACIHRSKTIELPYDLCRSLTVLPFTLNITEKRDKRKIMITKNTRQNTLVLAKIVMSMD